MLRVNEPLFHGGTAELWSGTIIRPDMAHTRWLDNCQQCQAQKAEIFMPG